jgi:hypothetical protein
MSCTFQTVPSSHLLLGLFYISCPMCWHKLYSVCNVNYTSACTKHIMYRSLNCIFIINFIILRDTPWCMSSSLHACVFHTISTFVAQRVYMIYDTNCVIYEYAVVWFKSYSREYNNVRNLYLSAISHADSSALKTGAMYSSGILVIIY